MIVPFADFFNHSPEGNTHYILNIKHEMSNKPPEGYITKKRRMDLSIFDKFGIGVTGGMKDAYFLVIRHRIDYIERNLVRVGSLD